MPAAAGQVARVALLAFASLALVACTASTSGPARGTSPAPVASASAVAGGAAAWEQTANFSGTGVLPLPVEVRLYPLQRLSNRVLLTVDLRSSVTTSAFSPFCAGESCGDLSGISLIDTAARMRYGPLRSGATGPLMTSSTQGLTLKAGFTYRFGSIFADPGTDAVAVDLQQAGVATQVPIQAGFPQANLISTRPPGTGRWNPSVVRVGTLVTAPVPALIGEFQANRHPLVGKIVGGRVNDAPGMVTISADRLFDGRSARLAAGGPGLIKQAADILTARADPGAPLAVVAYTDAQGTTNLSRARAQTASQQLGASLKQFTVRPRGAGSSFPVAAGTTSSGQDSPAGRALNRRIEVSYRMLDGGDVPQPAAPASAATSARTTAPTSSASSYLRPALPLTVPIPPTAPATTMAPSMTPSAGSAVGVPGLIKVGPVQLEPGSRARFTAAITSVRVDGGMTVVSLLIRSDAAANPVGAFSTQGGRRTDVGAFHLIDRGTGQVFVPAYDARDPGRVAGTFTHRLDAETPYRYTFFTTALPAGLTSVDVALAGLGTAASAPVVRS